MYAITAINLTKYFFHQKGIFGRQKITAVNNVNLLVQKGEVFGLLGPNGAGKTTLIKMLTTLLPPSNGEMTVNGFNLGREEKIRESISLIYSGERSFYQRLTAQQNLEFFAALYGMSFPSARRKAGELLEMTGLKDSADVRFEEYSSGMKQRLSIARSLLNDPAVIFMDEPTKGLDPVQARKFRKFVKEFLIGEKKKTVFLATHQLDEANEMCDSVAIMHLGEIKLCGSMEEITASGRNALYEIFLGVIGERRP